MTYDEIFDQLESILTALPESTDPGVVVSALTTLLAASLCVAYRIDPESSQAGELRAAVYRAVDAVIATLPAPPSA